MKDFLLENKILEQDYIKNMLLKHENIIDKYNEQYHNLKLTYNNTFHDRYFIIDDNMYHCGASINRIGYKTFSITLLSDKEVCESLNNKVNDLLK